MRPSDIKERAERIAGLEREQKDLREQIKALTAQIGDEVKEAESAGYSKRALRQVARELNEDAEELQARFDFEADVSLYREACGVGSAARVIANEMTDVEKLTVERLGVDSDLGRAAVEKGRKRALDKLAKRDSQRPLEVVK